MSNERAKLGEARYFMVGVFQHMCFNHWYISDGCLPNDSILDPSAVLDRVEEAAFFSGCFSRIGRNRRSNR